MDCPNPQDIGIAMIIAEIRCWNFADWRGQLRDSDTGLPIGTEWRAEQRGALIGMMSKWIPLTRIDFIDVGDLAFD